MKTNWSGPFFGLVTSMVRIMLAVWFYIEMTEGKMNVLDWKVKVQKKNVEITITPVKLKILPPSILSKSWKNRFGYLSFINLHLKNSLMNFEKRLVIFMWLWRKRYYQWRFNSLAKIWKLLWCSKLLPISWLQNWSLISEFPLWSWWLKAKQEWYMTISKGHESQDDI